MLRPCGAPFPALSIPSEWSAPPPSLSADRAVLLCAVTTTTTHPVVCVARFRERLRTVAVLGGRLAAFDNPTVASSFPVVVFRGERMQIYRRGSHILW